MPNVAMPHCRLATQATIHIGPQTLAEDPTPNIQTYSLSHVYIGPTLLFIYERGLARSL